MEFEGLISDALEVYKILYPFIEKYGPAAFELLKTLIDSNIHPQDITNEQLEQAAQGVMKLTQEVQNA